MQIACTILSAVACLDLQYFSIIPQLLSEIFVTPRRIQRDIRTTHRSSRTARYQNNTQVFTHSEISEQPTGFHAQRDIRTTHRFSRTARYRNNTQVFRYNEISEQPTGLHEQRDIITHRSSRTARYQNNPQIFTYNVRYSCKILMELEFSHQLVEKSSDNK